MSSGPELLRVEGLVKRFGGLTAVDGVSFTVAPGEIFGLIGPNGSGKTTLFNLISGFMKPTAGTIHFQGQAIHGWPTHRVVKAGLARTFQIPKPFKRLSVFDNVLTAAFTAHPGRKEAEALANETLEFCGLIPIRDQLGSTLTIGDRKRLEITRALATQPKLLLLDETFAGLNPSELTEAIELVQRIRESGVTVLLVEHIMKVVVGLSDRILAINFGKPMVLGAPEEVMANPAVVEAYLGAEEEDHVAQG